MAAIAAGWVEMHGGIPSIGAREVDVFVFFDHCILLNTISASCEIYLVMVGMTQKVFQKKGEFRKSIRIPF